MKNRHVLIFFLAAALLSMTFLTVHIPFVSAIDWSTENQLTTDPLQDYGPAIMQGGDGTVWVVWSSNRMGYVNYELFYKNSSNYGLDWSNDTRLTEDPFGNESDDVTPSIMQASNGTIWVVWSSFRTGDYELFYKTTSNNGASWSGETRLTTNAGYDTSPSIMQASNGLIWVVWTSNRNGNDDLFYKTYNGASWSTDILLTTDSYPDQFPSIMQASNGTIWVVWSSFRTGDYELFYKTFNGIAWSSPHQLTSNSDFDTAPSIAQARDGTIWVVWQSGDIAELYYKTYNGSAWSSDTKLTVNTADDIDPSIAQINDKKIWVVWTANRVYGNDIYYKTSSEIMAHDVTIANVTPSATTVKRGETVSISVEAENQGDYTETFKVNCSANTATIGTQTITLANGTSTTLTFSWNTTGVDERNYTIRAEASVVPGEIDTADNTFIDDKVYVKILGDVNGDGIVDMNDLALVDEAYGKVEGEPGYNPEADLNCDGVIDIYDVGIVGKSYGKTVDS